MLFESRVNVAEGDGDNDGDTWRGGAGDGEAGVAG